jgi:hypothetical protein
MIWQHKKEQDAVLVLCAEGVKWSYQAKPTLKVGNTSVLSVNFVSPIKQHL